MAAVGRVEEEVIFERLVGLDSVPAAPGVGQVLEVVDEFVEATGVMAVDALGGGHVIEQRIRNRIIEYFELASSFAAQREYEQSVPIAHVPYEVINQLEDWVPKDPGALTWHPEVFTDEEVLTLREFYVVWDETAKAVPRDYPSLHDVQAMPAWDQLRQVAETAVAIFARRGKLPEDHEAP